MIHCVAVDLEQCQVSIRICPHYASTNQRKTTTKERELNDSSTFSVKDLRTENDEHFCQEFEAEHPENQEPIAVRVRLGHSHSGTLTVVTMARRKNLILKGKISIEYYR